MLCKRRQISDTAAHCRSAGLILGAYDPCDAETFRTGNQVTHKVIIFRHILPYRIGRIPAVGIASVDQSEFHADKIIVCPFELIVMTLDFVALHDLIDHIFEFLRIAEPQSIYDIVVELIFAVEYKEKLVVFFRPFPGEDLVLGLKELFVVHHLEKDIRIGIGYHRDLYTVHVRLHDGTGTDTEDILLCIQ